MSNPFTVKHNADEDTWSVFLPHQCDSWEIVGDAWYGGEPHDKAVQELTQFINDATYALTMLMQRREIAPGA